MLFWLCVFFTTEDTEGHRETQGFGCVGTLNHERHERHEMEGMLVCVEASGGVMVG